MRVLYTLAPPSSRSNPYAVTLLGMLSKNVDVVYFSWQTALFGKYDVVHLQWPEYLLIGGPLKRGMKCVALLALVIRLRLLATPVVYTVHNLQPHAHNGLIARRLLGLLLGRSCASIYLNESTENDTVRGVTILHGWYEAGSSSAKSDVTSPLRLLLFGLLRPYKGVESLIDAVRRSSISRGLQLRIVGEADTKEYEQSLRAATEGCDRVDMAFGHLDESRLSDELRAADLVVLPYLYFYNSGVALRSLSAMRPILVPSCPSADSLAAEVGASWVLRYHGEVSAAAIEDAVEALRSAGNNVSGPDLSHRPWEVIAELHAGLYSLCLDHRSHSRDLPVIRRGVRNAVSNDVRFCTHSAKNTL